MDKEPSVEFEQSSVRPEALSNNGQGACEQVEQAVVYEDKTTTRPLLSVMLCTNQLDEYFEQSLASVQRQTLRKIEILIVVNGVSEDQVQGLVSRVEDPRVRVIQTDMHGVTFSRNLALHVASSDLIAVLDADDIAYPDRLEKQYNFMVSHPDITVLGSNYDTIDAYGQKISTSDLPLKDSIVRSKLVSSNPICHPTAMFRREAAMAVGGYTGGLAQDYELWVAMQADPETMFVNMPESLVGYRVPVVSKARMSRRAYAQVASAQWRQFALTKQPKWFFASFVSVAKAWFRSRQN